MREMRKLDCNMGNKRKLLCLFFLLVALTGSSQCRYCKSYEDFVSGQWESLDTIFCEYSHKPKKMLSEGVSYYMSTDDIELTQKLRNDAFAIMRGDTLYVNSLKINIPKIRLNPGFVKAKYMGRRGLLIVAPGLTGQIGGRDYDDKAPGIAAAATAVGVASLALTGVGFIVLPVPNRNTPQQLMCYLISGDNKNEDGIKIRQVDDRVMSLLLLNNDELYEEYFSVKKAQKRQEAKHVLSILDELGLYESVPQPVE